MIVMANTVPELDRIRNALWRIVDDSESPRTVQLEAITKLIDLEKEVDTMKPPPSMVTLNKHRNRAKGGVD